jgi:hypothetical protein
MQLGRGQVNVTAPRLRHAPTFQNAYRALCPAPPTRNTPSNVSDRLRGALLVVGVMLEEDSSS